MRSEMYVATSWYTGICAERGEPGIERGQALADISRLVLCCHSNKHVYRLQIRPIVYN